MKNVVESLHNLSVRTLLLGSGILGVVLALIMAGMGYLSAQRLASTMGYSVELSETLQNHTAADARMDSLRSDALRAIAVKQNVSTESEADIRKDLAEEINILRSALATNAAAPLTPEIDEGYTKAKALLEPFIAASNTEIDLIFSNPAEGIKKFEQYRNGFSQLEEVMDATRTLVESAVAKTKAENDRTVVDEWKWFGGAVLIGILLIGGLSIFLARRVLALLRDIADATVKLAAGDWSQEIPGVNRNDEIGKLASAMTGFRNQLSEAERSKAEQTQIIVSSIGAGLENLAKGDVSHRISAALVGPFAKLKEDFNTAMERLQETLHGVFVSTGQITTGANEMSAAADDLSRRTEQQAASLEETAAALEEITATVKRTASNAKDARASVTTAKNVAEEGGRVVNTAIEAMDAISQSSTQITDIIGVIDEIAFQTNLLALNAGVEAARAGEAGRGFAVVASEVRSLAQRSSEAAKQIKTLINASGQQVSSGVRLVGESGAALRRIMDQVQQINGLVTEMAQAAEQQSTGIEQVNAAVSQMDQVTQQNAAMVEQSTAASRNLAGETQHLHELVRFFDVGQGTEIARKPERQQRSAVRPSTPAPKPAHAPVRVRRGAAQLAQAVDSENWTEF